MSSIDLTVAGTTTIALTSSTNALALTQADSAIALTTIQWNAQLDDIAGLNVTDGNFIVGDGTNWVAESGNTARTSLGLGTGDSPTFTNLTLGNAPTVSYGTGDITISLTGATGRMYATTAGSNQLVSTFVNRNTDTGNNAGSGFLFAAGASATGWIGGVGVERIDASSNSRLLFRILSAGVLTPAGTTAPLYLEGSATGRKAIFNAYVNIIGGEDTQQLIIQAHSTQTANILEIQKSDGTVYSGADERGILFSDGGIDVDSVFIGSDAGNIAASGALRNIGIGQLSLSYLTSGDSNIGLGSYALERNTAGGSNIGIGYRAGNFNIGGSSNVYIGTESGYGVSGQSNNQNTAVGTKALRGIRTGDYNVAFGDSAGRLLTTGSRNVFLGYGAGYRQTTLSNLLIVDDIARADVATELTNAILYGVMAAAQDDQTLRINASLFLPEKAAAVTDVATYGQLWVLNGDPNTLMYTDGDGTDFTVDVTPV